MSIDELVDWQLTHSPAAQAQSKPQVMELMFPPAYASIMYAWTGSGDH